MSRKREALVESDMSKTKRNTSFHCLGHISFCKFIDKIQTLRDYYIQ